MELAAGALALAVALSAALAGCSGAAACLDPAINWGLGQALFTGSMSAS